MHSKVNRILLTSGIIAVFTAAVHTFVGTPEIKDPLLSSSLPLSIALLLYSCWHLVTVVLAFSGAALIWCALPRGSTQAGALPVFISSLWILFGFVFIAVALLYSGPSALLVLPQWILLIPVGVLGLLGSRRGLTASARA